MKMRKTSRLIAFAACAALMLAGCSKNDNVDDRDSINDNGTTVTEKDRDTRDDLIDDDRNDRNDGNVGDDIASTGDKVASKADEIGDDVADGINGGLDTAESLVDDVLK